MSAFRTKEDAEAREGQEQGEEQEHERQLAEYNADILRTQPGLAEAFLAMLEAVPEPDDDAAAKIVAAILGATDAEGLDAPWDTDGFRKNIGRALVVDGITKRPSDYVGGLRVYLGCDCRDYVTGEKLFLTTGSVSSVAQLVRAHTLGVFPLYVVAEEATKPTKNGFTPYHLRIFKPGQPT